MRRLLPHLAGLFATLLLLQWGQGAAACLAMLRLAPAGVVCHAESGRVGDGRVMDVGLGGGQEDGGRHAGVACPHCAPLPPAFAASAPGVAASTAVAVVVMTLLPPIWVDVATRASAHQPRGPPLRA